MLHHLRLGTGAPLLVLHGSRLDHRHMRESLEPIFEMLPGWERVYVDLPGHGKSPARDDIRTQDDLLSAVMEFVAEALPAGRFGVIGESRGSYLAQGLVHRCPERVSGVALIVPGGSPASDPARLPRHEVLDPDPSIRPELSESEVSRFDGMMVVQTREIVRKLRRSKIPAIAHWDDEQEARISQTFDFSFDADMGVSSFDGPSLVIAGRQDSLSGFLDAVDLLPRYPRASLAVLDCAGHGLAWERPEVFQALMRDWLARLSLARAT